MTRNSQPPDNRSKNGLTLPLSGLGLATIALAIMISAGLGTRIGFWHFRTGFTLLKYGVYFEVAALVLSLAGTIKSVKRGLILGVLLAFTGTCISVVSIAVPLTWKRAASGLPRIHDITTDTVNPPSFVAVVSLRENAPNSLEYGGTEIATMQRQAYPDIKTFVMDLPLERAFSKALDAAHEMGWNIAAADPTQGRIEGTDTTFWFGFKDDIVVRIAPAGNRSLLDVRSVSRVGISDVGTNAKRIRAYLKKLGRNE